MCNGPDREDWLVGRTGVTAEYNGGLVFAVAGMTVTPRTLHPVAPKYRRGPQVRASAPNVLEGDAWASACCAAAGSGLSATSPTEHRAGAAADGEYLCAKGHEFEVPFAVDAEVPTTWECIEGSVARRVDGNEPEQKKAKPPRTHWDMLLERRSIAELEELLDERLELLRERRAEIA